MSKYIISGVALLALAFTAVWLINNRSDPSSQIKSDMSAVSIEEYVRANISRLSPVSEQLGGTFYVTSVEAHEGTSTVSYEDGHSAYTADFTYELDPSPTITSFIVRDI